MAQKNRRLKRVRVSGEMMLALLNLDTADMRRRGADTRITGLPADARILDSRHDAPYDVVELLVTSETFPELPYGGPIPELPLTCISIALEADDEGPDLCGKCMQPTYGPCPTCYPRPDAVIQAR